MIVERRALTAAEIQDIPDPESFELDLSERVLAASAGGLLLTVLCLVVNWFATNVVGYGLAAAIGQDLSALSLAAWLVFSVVCFAWWSALEVAERKELTAKRDTLLARDDLIVEQHDLADCKFIREPEHGQPMFFVRTEEGTVLFVFQGQEELDHDFEDNPLDLKPEDRPKTGLKVVRDPATKNCVLQEFTGDDFPLLECREIRLGPGQWPANGKVIAAPWEELDRRYRLRKWSQDDEEE